MRFVHGSGSVLALLLFVGSASVLASTDPTGIILALEREPQLTERQDGTPVFGLPEVDRLSEYFEAGRAIRILEGLAEPALYRLSFRQPWSRDDLELLAREFTAKPGVAYAEPDWIATAQAIPDDPLFPDQWGLHNTGQTGGTPDADIDASEAWDIQTGSPSVLIAVLDTGVDLDHPDLVGKLLPGYDFVNGDDDPDDDNGHGTHVAGIVGAGADDGLGVAGVCWGCSILPIKVLGADGTGFYSQLIQGIEHAADEGARVLCLSLAGSEPSQALQDAVDYARAQGCLVVAAAGNANHDQPLHPAACDGVLSVAALDHDDVRYRWSGFGQWVDISAPGDTIWSTLWEGQHAPWSGSSTAAALVAGTIGLVVSENPDWSSAFVESQLLRTANPVDGVNPGLEGLLGTGRVNAVQALTDVPEAVPSIEEVVILDSDDGLLDPGETARLVVTIQAEEADLIGLVGSLTSTDPYVAILDGSGSWDNIGLGSSGDNEADSFEVSLDIGCPHYRELDLQLELTDGNGDFWTLPVLLRSSPEEIEWTANITTPTTWEHGKTYLLPESLLLTASLTIEPGVTVKLAGDCRLLVQEGGQLTTVGTSEEPITFTALDPLDRWDRIELSAPGEHIFQYVRFHLAEDVLTGPVHIFTDNWIEDCSGTLEFSCENLLRNTFIRSGDSWYGCVELHPAFSLDGQCTIEQNQFEDSGRLEIQTTVSAPDNLVFIQGNTVRGARDGSAFYFTSDTSGRRVELPILVEDNDLLDGSGPIRFDSGFGPSTVRNNRIEAVTSGIYGAGIVADNYLCGSTILSCGLVQGNRISSSDIGLGTCGVKVGNTVSDCKVGNYGSGTLEANLFVSCEKAIKAIGSSGHPSCVRSDRGSRDPVCRHNTVLWSQEAGILIPDHETLNQHLFSENNLIPTSGWAVQNENPDDVDLQDCYWGPTTTTEMDTENTWPTASSNIEAIKDIRDHPDLGWVDFGSWRSEPVQEAPGFLMGVTLGPPSPVGIGPLEIRLEFSRPMDTSIQPTVGFGPAAPSLRHPVTGDWDGDERTWIGQVSIGLDTGDGLQLLTVADARDPDGMTIPVDSTHGFTVQTGAPMVTGFTAVDCSGLVRLAWQPVHNTDLAGYSVQYDTDSGEPYIGTGADQGNSPIDTGLQNNLDLTGLVSGETYFLVVQAYDDLGLMGPLSDELSVGLSAGTPTSTGTPTPTSTLSATPTRSPTPTNTYSPTPTRTLTPTPTLSPTRTPTLQPTRTPSPTLTPTDTPSSLPTPTLTVLPSPTATLSPEPTWPFGVRIDMPEMVHPGDPFWIIGRIDNPGPPRTGVPTLFVLEIHGNYFFWPSWRLYRPPQADRIDYRLTDLSTGTTYIQVHYRFYWPDTGEEQMLGLHFYGALLNPEMTALDGRMDLVTWGYGP